MTASGIAPTFIRLPEVRRRTGLGKTTIYDWMKEAPAPEGDEATRFGVRAPQGQMKPDDAWYALLRQAPFAK